MLEVDMKLMKYARRALVIDDALVVMKEMYRELDEIVDYMLFKGVSRVELDHKVLMLVDNFEKKNVVFRAHGTRRFELKITGVGDTVDVVFPTRKKKST